MVLLFVLLFAFFSPITVQAQESILWKVSGNNLATDSYLLGTLKFIDKNNYMIPPNVLKYLKKCTVFAIEDPVDHHAQYELNKAVHFPKGKSLATQLSKEDYAKLENFFEEEFHIKKGKFKRKYAKFIPLAVSILMTRLSLHDRVRFYDIELLQFAKKNKIKTYSLEPIEREAQALQAFPLSRQDTILMHSVEYFERQKNDFSMLQKAYLKGHLNETFNHSVHLFENDSSFMELFYYQRNREWLPKLEKMFSDQQSFVSVGLLHLKGNEGLIALLRRRGYTVTSIPIAD